MTTTLLTHADGLEHVTPPGHPEQVARLERVWAALGGKDLIREEAPLAGEDDLRLTHPQAHIDHIKASEPAEGLIQLDADTWMSPGSVNAALRGVGAALVTLGGAGAVLVDDDEAWYANTPPVQVRSTVGAGDSALAGYLLA